MRITRERLERIIAEELGLALRELADGDDPKARKKSKKSNDQGPQEPETVSADGTGKDLGGNPDGVKKGGRKKDALPVGTDPMQPDVDGMDDADPGPTDAEETDDAAEDETDALDPHGDADKEPSGKINDELTGKTVQAITIEPKSKLLPGAKEVLVTFNEVTDALRILVTQSGQVKFFYRGQLHDLP